MLVVYCIINLLPISKAGHIKVLKRRKSTGSITQVTREPTAELHFSTENIDDAELIESIHFLQTDTEPWPIVYSKWHDTRQYRIEKLLGAFSKFQTIADYASAYPCLKQPDGYKLLVADFNDTYPEKANCLYTTLHTCREKIINLVQTGNCHSPEQANQLLSHVEDNQSSP